MGPKTTKAVAIVEQLIDEVGLQTVLDAMAIVCNEKSEHIASNWGDKPLAGQWGNTAGDVAFLAAIAGRRGLT